MQGFSIIKDDGPQVAGHEAMLEYGFNGRRGTTSCKTIRCIAGCWQRRSSSGHTGIFGRTFREDCGDTRGAGFVAA